MIFSVKKYESLITCEFAHLNIFNRMKLKFLIIRASFSSVGCLFYSTATTYFLIRILLWPKKALPNSKTLYQIVAIKLSSSVNNKSATIRFMNRPQPHIECVYVCVIVYISTS